MKIDIFTQNLRVLRLSKKYTQEEMGAKLNIQRQTYCNYENGRRLPNIEMLMRISKILGVSLDTLVKDIDASPPIITTDEQTYQETLLKLVSDFTKLSMYEQQQVIDFISYQKRKHVKCSSTSSY